MNLSPATVSLTLNGRWKEVGISPATHRQILNRANELGYRRNYIATSLRTRVTKTIGVIVPNIRDDMYDHMLHGIESAVGEEYTLLLGVTEYDGNKERKFLHSFQQRMVDGLILVHADHPENIALLKELQEQKVPVVQADRAYDGLCADLVETDNESLGFALTERFIQQGFRGIYFLRSPHFTGGANRRVEGYRRAMRARGRKIRIVPERPIISTPNRDECIRKLVRNLLPATPKPFAIVANDLPLVFGALDALNEAGLEHPKDFAIASVANDSRNPLYRFLPSSVTLAVWSTREMGFQAGKLLLQRIQHRVPVNRRPQTVRISFRLLPNRSAARRVSSHEGLKLTTQ